MEIRKATFSDMLNVAEIHKVCFPGYLSTKIGCGRNCKLMSKLYVELLQCCPELFFVITNDDQQIIGFAAGDYHSNQYYLDRYIHNNFWAIARRMAWLLLKGDKKAWAKLRLRSKKLTFQIIDHRLDNVPKTEICDIVSFCILPDYRGKGLSGQLIEAFLDSVRCQHKGFVTVTTWKSNKNAINFYMKHGFEKYRVINDIAYTFLLGL